MSCKRLNPFPLCTFGTESSIKTLEWDLYLILSKGQLISKAIYDLLTSPKKRTDEFVSFPFFTLHGKQIKFVSLFSGRIYGSQICFSK